MIRLTSQSDCGQTTANPNMALQGIALKNQSNAVITCTRTLKLWTHPVLVAVIVSVVRYDRKQV